MKNILKRLWKEQEGQDLTEYGLLVALIGLAAVVAMRKLDLAIKNAFAIAEAGANLTTGMS